MLRISLYLLLSLVLYKFYMYSRRIRAESTSLSQLKIVMEETKGRNKMLNTIGKKPLSSSAFPFFPFRKKSIFISYMHASAWSSDTAGMAHKWLSDKGFQVFLDRSTIPSGVLWRQYLIRSISECGFFVCVIDGNIAATEWVLAESAYAALLRKSIGKPRILLVVKNVQKITQDQQNMFHINYFDLFQNPHSNHFGGGVLFADHGKLTAEKFLIALKEVQPMCLLFCRRKLTQSPHHPPLSSNQAIASTLSNNLQLTDHFWKMSLLLVKLLEAEDVRQDSLNLLITKSSEWLRSNRPEKKAISLNTLRLLFKSDQLPFQKDLLDQVLDIFFTDASVVVKLAALDFLGAISYTPNPLSNISEVEVRRIIELRSKLIKKMNVSQREYSAKGVYADIEKELSGRTPKEALWNVISRVENVYA